MIKNAFFLFPLQTPSIDLFAIDDPTLSPEQIILFIAVFAVIIVILIFVNKRHNTQTKGRPGNSGGGSIFSGFALRRMARQIGLNGEQRKMLGYVFKIDGVVDPERSLNNAALLDRHFRRAYRVIEQSSNTEEEAQRKFSVLFSARNILENSAIGTVPNTRHLKTDTILNVIHFKDKYEVTILSTKMDHISVETPTTILGSQIKIPNGTKLSAVFFTKNNKGYSFETRVVGHGSTHGQPTMFLAHSNNLIFLSQRRFRRRQASIACFLNLVYVEGSGKKQRLVVDKRRLNGSIADISVGGCSIKAVVPVQVGAKFKIEFVQRDTTVAALGQVLRTNRA